MDLAKLVNMKGGIGGEPVEVIVRHHGNEPQRGIECYSRLSREGVFVFDTLSTPVPLAILPRVMNGTIRLAQPIGGRWPTISAISSNCMMVISRTSRWPSPISITRSGRASEQEKNALH